MKINCEKCQAKYSIADEKVRGKTFKIRCKKCSHVIIVRDKPAAASAAASSTAAEEDDAPLAEDEAAGWHIAVGGETIGPLSEDEIRERIESGQLDRDTSVWRDGFEDWAPLSTVTSFSDVLERESVRRKESRPLASDGPDFGGGFGGSDSHSGSDAATALSSPRVSNLTAQRNENSVLFSLDSLQKLATSNPSPSSSPVMGGSASPAPTSFTPSTTAPTSEGSGLIDIRAMSAVVGTEPSSRRRDEALIPSFGGSGFGGLAAQPLAVEEPPLAVSTDLPPPQKSKSALPVVLFSTFFSVIAMAGLGYFFLVEPLLESRAAETEAKLALLESRAEAAEAEKERLEKAEAEKAAAAEQEAEDGVAEEDEKGADPASGSADKARDRGDRQHRPTSPRRSRPSTSPSRNHAGASAKDDEVKLPAVTGSSDKSDKSSPSRSKPEKSSGGSDSNIDVDCLLDPSLPKCSKSKGSASAKPTRKVDPSLPESLSQSQLLSGLSRAKSDAKSCGKRYGAKSGERVTVRMTIDGGSGKVSSAVAQGEHASSPLGKCVASAAQKSKFPKFQKDNQGLMYNFKM